ncbi:MAG: hypothetical protein LBL66_00770, partial [Clostridiales bacterium]|nr:hypothetical protein [Clostridiales bacterium]
FSFEGFYEIFARIPAETGGVMSMSANLCREVGFAEARDIELFFEYLTGGAAPPNRPAIRFSVSDDKPYFSVKPDPARPVKRCALFYAYGGAARDRNWERKEAFMSADGEYIANIDCYDIPDPLYVYGAAYYEDGFSLCTRVLKKTAAELNAPVKRLVPSHLLYAPGGGRDSFTTVDSRVLIHYKDNVERVSGPLGIEGVRAATGKLAAFKPGDPRFSPLRGSAIQINAYSAAPAGLVVGLRDGKGVVYYSKETPLCGGEIWQKAALDAAAFKTAQKTALVDFSDIKALWFEAPAGVVVSSIIWT